MRMVQGSLEPQLEVDLTVAAGPADLSAATKVEVRGEFQGAQLFRREVTPEAGGVVKMDWQTGDTDEAGRIWVDVGVTWPGDRLQWFRAAEVVDIETLS